MLSGTELVSSILFLIALLALSIMDFALTAVNKVAVRRLIDTHKFKFAPALSAMVEDRSDALMSFHILIQLVIVAGSVIVFSAFERRLVPFWAGVGGTIVAMLAFILLFRHLVPRLFASRNPEMWLIRLFPALKICHWLMRPLARLHSLVLNYFHSWEEEMEPAKEEEASEEEIQEFIDAGQEEGILDRQEGEMIQSIVHFGEKVAREVMTPRTQIIAADINSPTDKVVQLVTSKGKSRIPVYRDDIDNIEGIIHERDLLRASQRGDKNQSLRSLVKPAHFIPETKPVDDLLNEMKQNGEQMVLVVDEYGGVSGLITMEDLVEEIVGDIHDAESTGEKIAEESPGVYIVPGGLDLSTLNETLGSPFVEQTECTTVAGAVVELFGKLPAAGERIEHQGVSVEVLDADRRRVHRLRMRVLAPKPNSR